MRNLSVCDQVEIACLYCRVDSINNLECKDYGVYFGHKVPSDGKRQASEMIFPSQAFEMTFLR
ncbi:hypothetical protein [Actinotignum urinale]